MYLVLFETIICDSVGDECELFAANGLFGSMALFFITFCRKARLNVTAGDLR